MMQSVSLLIQFAVRICKDNRDSRDRRYQILRNLPQMPEEMIRYRYFSFLFCFFFFFLLAHADKGISVSVTLYWNFNLSPAFYSREIVKAELIRLLKSVQKVRSGEQNRIEILIATAAFYHKGTMLDLGGHINKRRPILGTFFPRLWNRDRVQHNIRTFCLVLGEILRVQVALE